MNRYTIGGLSLSAVALVGLLVTEHFVPSAMIPVPGDKLTIGFGTTEGVKLGDTITVSKALQRALSDVGKYEGAIKQCVKVPLTQNEFDAYTSLAYNIGASAFCKSTLVKLLNEYQYTEACHQIKRWDKFKGKPLRGLTIRRQKEYQLCIT